MARHGFECEIIERRWLASNVDWNVGIVERWSDGEYRPLEGHASTGRRSLGVGDSWPDASLLRFHLLKLRRTGKLRRPCKARPSSDGLLPIFQHSIIPQLPARLFPDRAVGFSFWLGNILLIDTARAPVFVFHR